ncbi:unnamed protein product, partial [Meganyctiphanes norvegica]
MNRFLKMVVIGGELRTVYESSSGSKADMIHKGKSFCCPYCSYQAYQKCDLEKHIRTHTGEKPYACKYCSFRSAQSCHLRRHMRIHTGEKSIVCQFCSFRTAYSDSMKHHVCRFQNNK